MNRPWNPPKKIRCSHPTADRTQVRFTDRTVYVICRRCGTRVVDVRPIASIIDGPTLRPDGAVLREQPSR